LAEPTQLGLADAGRHDRHVTLALEQRRGRRAPEILVERERGGNDSPDMVVGQDLVGPRLRSSHNRRVREALATHYR